ncbi:hypothetical protein THIOM_002162 [Candidatus Thiomargarita nelsonii]|uniref:Uncharacterized protein n=1 Tax=Candidatus Thiomargarita nelsonii TaxID=1003181 RepID=A0A0A6NZB0_9GAMM|nr:hypothetical protein THIOM_002162 [Candidatus Thiomargarita nelsonii]
MIFQQYRNQSPKTDRLGARLITVFILMLLESVTFAADSLVWQPISEPTLLRQGQNRLITPDKYNLLAVDIDALDNLISQAPLESANQIQSIPLVRVAAIEHFSRDIKHGTTFHRLARNQWHFKLAL